MTKHVPVLLKEVVEKLNISKPGVYIDCTLGGGGYFEAIIERLNRLKESSLLIGIDQDLDSINEYLERTKKAYRVEVIEKEYLIEYSKLKSFEYTIGKTEIVLVNMNFSNLKKFIALLNENKVIEGKKILGIVADLGFSSDQLISGRGFSFKEVESELDMRMNKSLNVKAKDILNAFGKNELADLFYSLADEPRSRILAELLIRKRNNSKYEKVSDLLKVLNEVKGITDKEDFYQRIFQALRIVVNSELDNLKELLEESLDVLEENGRMLIVSFHSGEDRIVKKYIESNNLIKISENIITPSVKEILKNPRSRSAKLRGYIKNK